MRSRSGLPLASGQGGGCSATAAGLPAGPLRQGSGAAALCRTRSGWPHGPPRYCRRMVQASDKARVSVLCSDAAPKPAPGGSVPALRAATGSGFRAAALRPASSRSRRRKRPVRSGPSDRQPAPAQSDPPPNACRNGCPRRPTTERRSRRPPPPRQRAGASARRQPDRPAAAALHDPERWLKVQGTAWGHRPSQPSDPVRPTRQQV